MSDKLQATPAGHFAAGRVPGLESRRVDREQHKALAEIAMSTFVAMTNAGAPLQEAVLAVYVSGLDHGARTARDVLTTSAGANHAA